ncbi:MAG: DUF554 domain-containing protein [Clostridia bacterium]|nr:DUF554 domain-containing protein [Clostridia bacterium]
MLGVLVNMVTVLIGGTIGNLFKKGIPQKITDALMIGLGLCTIYIGISGALKGENTLVLILSIAFGAIIGTLIDIDALINRGAKWVESKFKKNGKKTSIAEGIVTSTLLFCVGSMTVVGSLNAGLRNDNEMLYTKAMLDAVSSTVLASTLGVGVILAAVPVLIIQGGLVLLSGLLSGVLTMTAINEMTCAGSVIIIALGLNLMGISKFKVANYIPAIFLAPVFSWIFTLLPISL